MINPAFVVREGMQLEEEGCLSVPGFNATVVRPSRAVLTGLDRDGVEQTVEGKGLLARAFQHEMDHLDGVVFVDRLRGIKRDLIVRKIQKLKRTGKMVTARRLRVVYFGTPEFAVPTLRRCSRPVPHSRAAARMTSSRSSRSPIGRRAAGITWRHADEGGRAGRWRSPSSSPNA